MAARKKTPAVPTPVAVTTICSVCGMGWELHGKAPTTEDCIRLLKAELARRPITVPQPIPYPYPVPVPRRPWYGEPNGWRPSDPPTITYSGNSNSSNVQLRTPARAELTCSAVSSV